MTLLKLHSIRLLLPLVLAASALAAPKDFFEIQVVDEQTGRGVPLVEVSTVNHLKWLTDNAGCVAFLEPGLMGQEVFFFIRSPGYEFKKDGFGYDGKRVTPTPGGKAVFKITRVNLAERLYRITGEGLYRDTVLLGQQSPLAEPLGTAQVMGQDSVEVAFYQNKYHWFWGDTQRIKYPLGNFWTSGATSDPPGQGGLPPDQGINLRYFTDPEGFARAMCQLGSREGVVWINGLLTLKDDQGRERLVTHYARMQRLGKQLAHGLAVWDDEKKEFVKLKDLEAANTWQFPHGHPFKYREGNTDYLYFGHAFPNVRVKADWQALQDPGVYEAWTAGSIKGRYAWTRQGPPVDSTQEAKWVKSGKLKPDETTFLPADVRSGQPIEMHRGSVAWNDFRHAFILIATQIHGGPSHLGEIWYAEAPAPTGPWRKTIKVASHPKYTFYNPVHHAFFDEPGGRAIYFEGTYTETFSGNPTPAPRYDYNQIMYRLRLDDPALKW